jgi:hypothetical protein
MPIEMSTTLKILLGLVLVMAGVAAALVWRSERRVSRWQEGYSEIRIGDSKQRVTALLGNPTAVKDCWDTSFSTLPSDVKKSCAEEYWYVAFLADWKIAFDREGKVISKANSVSP